MLGEFYPEMGRYFACRSINTKKYFLRGNFWVLKTCELIYLVDRGESTKQNTPICRWGAFICSLRLKRTSSYVLHMWDTCVSYQRKMQSKGAGKTDKLSLKYFLVICGTNSEPSIGLARKICRSFCKQQLSTTYTWHVRAKHTLRDFIST